MDQMATITLRLLRQQQQHHGTQVDIEWIVWTREPSTLVGNALPTQCSAFANFMDCWGYLTFEATATSDADCQPSMSLLKRWPMYTSSSIVPLEGDYYVDGGSLSSQLSGNEWRSRSAILQLKSGQTLTA
jgi:hypothetical protein